MEQSQFEVIAKSLNEISVYLNSTDWGTLVLVATLIVVMIYTIITHKLAKESTMLRESQYEPFLHVVHSNDINPEAEANLRTFYGSIRLLNLGKGIALDIEIEPFYTKGWVITTKPILKRMFARSSFDSMTENADVMNLHRHLNNENKNPSSVLILKCKDLIGRKYVFRYIVVASKQLQFENYTVK